MLNRKHKRYILILVTISVVSFLIYQYAYQKGYTKANLALPKTKQELSKNAAPASAVYDPKKLYSVVHVADGDTIDIENSGIKVRVRLLGINSPESVDQNRKVECYGKEASLFMTELVLGKKVRVEQDSGKPEKDQYGRLLAYIQLEDGLFVNQEMINKGYAYEYTYKSEKYKYQSDFKLAQKNAQKSKIGLWASDTCDGRK